MNEKSQNNRKSIWKIAVKIMSETGNTIQTHMLIHIYTYTHSLIHNRTVLKENCETKQKKKKLLKTQKNEYNNEKIH